MTLYNVRIGPEYLEVNPIMEITHDLPMLSQGRNLIISSGGQVKLWETANKIQF